MINSLKSIWHFLNYWYFRYLMATELYMVERWERVVVNVIVVIVCLVLSYFNYLILSYTSSISWLPSIWNTQPVSSS